MATKPDKDENFTTGGLTIGQKKTMAQAIRVTTTVQVAVARWMGSLIPILAQIDVKRKIADKCEEKNHLLPLL